MYYKNKRSPRKISRTSFFLSTLKGIGYNRAMNIYYSKENIGNENILSLFQEEIIKYQFQKIKKRRPFYQMTNHKGEYLFSVGKEIFSRNSIMIYFSDYSIEIKADLPDIMIIHHRKNSFIEADGNILQSYYLIEKEKILAKIQQKPGSGLLEWIIYTDEKEGELLGILFAIEFLKRELQNR